MIKNLMADDSGQLLEALRHHTGDLHKELDSRMSGGVFSEKNAYAAFLIMNAQILPGIERQLGRHLEYQSLIHWQERFRTSHLLNDLSELAVVPAQVVEFEVSSSPGTAAGLAYVLEGSRLGGRLIANKLSKSELGDLPVSFITHGEHAAYWSSFRDWLSTRPTDDGYRTEAMRAAVSLFELYLKIMTAEPEYR